MADLLEGLVYDLKLLFGFSFRVNILTVLRPEDVFLVPTAHMDSDLRKIPCELYLHEELVGLLQLLWVTERYAVIAGKHYLISVKFEFVSWDIVFRGLEGDGSPIKLFK